MMFQRACSQRKESRSESRFGTWFEHFPDLKAWFYPLWKQSSFNSGFWNAKKLAFGIVICTGSLILRTCERKALSECDSCVCILEMRADAMHGYISMDCTVGTKYYLAVRRSCSWLGRRLQCLWTHIVQITNSIAIRSGFRNVIHSFVNRPKVLFFLLLAWGRMKQVTARFDCIGLTVFKLHTVQYSIIILLFPWVIKASSIYTVIRPPDIRKKLIFRALE